MGISCPTCGKWDSTSELETKLDCSNELSIKRCDTIYAISKDNECLRAENAQLRAQIEAVKKPLTLAEIDTPNGWISSSARAAFKNGCLNAHHAILARLES